MNERDRDHHGRDFSLKKRTQNTWIVTNYITCDSRNDKTQRGTLKGTHANGMVYKGPFI